MKKRFRFHLMIDDEQVGEDGVIEIDQSVLDEGLTDDFKSTFYDLHDEAGVAAHIAWSMVVRRWKMSEIEGWMSDDSLATIIDYPMGYDAYQCNAEELE